MTPTSRSSFNSVDVLRTTAWELKELLDANKIHSVDLVQVYLSQIEKHNHKGANLRAIISMVARETILRTAEQLDKERENGKIRSPLHGIPILIKDNICTSAELGVPTTCGAIAFEKAICNQNAEIIDRLLQAGLILLGKANLDEMAAAKDFDLPTGWSAVEGQTNSPYVIGGIAPGDTVLGHSTPGGSSCGSAVGVAAGFAPLSIGTETDGSLVMPADRAALYTLKTTPGSLPMSGVLPWVPSWDAVGGMAKSAKDIALLTGIMDGGKDYMPSLASSWSGIRVGTLNPWVWKSGPLIKPVEGYTEQSNGAMEMAVNRIEQSGATVKRNVNLRRFSPEDSDMFDEVAWHDFGPAFAKFMANYSNTSVHTVRDLVNFNLAHAERALPAEHPGQEYLVELAERGGSVTEERYRQIRETLRHNNKDLGIDQTLTENGVDVLIGGPYGRIVTIASAAGYPIGTLPLGYADYNGRPFGMVVVAPANREDLIIRVMSAWEATFPARMPPPQLVNWDGTAAAHYGSSG